jgi:excisionase family DNA binding protein
VSRSHVYALVRAAKIPTVVIGRYYRFRLDALVEWEQRGGTRMLRSDDDGRA